MSKKSKMFLENIEKKSKERLKIGTTIQDKATGKIGVLENIYNGSSWPYDVVFEDGTSERYTLYGGVSDTIHSTDMLFPEHRQFKKNLLIKLALCDWLPPETDANGKRLECSMCEKLNECCELSVSEVIDNEICILNKNTLNQIYYQLEKISECCELSISKVIYKEMRIVKNTLNNVYCSFGKSKD